MTRVHWRALTALAVAGSAQPLLADNSDEWKFELTPYLWAAGMSGSTGPKGFATDVDMSFSDIWERLDGAFILALHARKGRWTNWVDYVSLSLSDDGNLAFLNVDLSLSQDLLEVGSAYQVSEQSPVSILGGVRYLDVDTRLKFSVDPPLPIKRKTHIGDNWVDPFVGLVADWPINEFWTIRARGDVGGFGVGSDFTWHAIVTANYNLSERWTLKFGYRHLDIDYDDNGFVMDLDESGLAFGAGFRF